MSISPKDAFHASRHWLLQMLRQHVTFQQKIFLVLTVPMALLARVSYLLLICNKLVSFNSKPYLLRGGVRLYWFNCTWFAKRASLNAVDDLVFTEVLFQSLYLLDDLLEERIGFVRNANVL